MFLGFLKFFLGISGNGLYMRDLDLNFFWLINRILETQFPGGLHLENMPNQTKSEN